MATSRQSGGSIVPQCLKSGSICVARRAKDKKWCRAVVESIYVLVEFPNFNTRCNLPVTDIKEIYHEINLPEQGIPCSLLAAKPKDLSWSASEIDCSTDRAQGRSLEIKFASYYNGGFQTREERGWRGRGGRNSGNYSNSMTFNAQDVGKVIGKGGSKIWELQDEKKKTEAEKWSKLVPIKKDFYIEDPKVANMHHEEMQHFKKMNNYVYISAPFGGDYILPNPIQTFEQCFGPYPDILKKIRSQGFKQPSPIQCQTWPIIMLGHDVIGISRNTGKTLAYILPALIHIEHQPVPRSERRGANVLIMAPTRELVLQIEEEVKKYAFDKAHCVCVYGGASRWDQIDRVTRGVDIVIATPGRLNDLAQAGVIDLSSVTYLVLDEADRMLDLGFEPQIRLVMYDIRPDRQTIMTSATWPEGVHHLATKYMNNPVEVFISSMNCVVNTVTQKIIFTEEDDKLELLTEFVNNMEEKDKIIVFVSKKTQADQISSDLILKGIECRCIHGSVVQCDRQQAIEDLKTGDARILIATDVASRGIDISDITHIINYDFPYNIVEYVHRVGRTGRAGKTGEAISFITQKNRGHAKDLIRILEETDQEVPEELMDMANKFDRIQERKSAKKRQESDWF